jgi:hypothetical protein
MLRCSPSRVDKLIIIREIAEAGPRKLMRG